MKELTNEDIRKGLQELCKSPVQTFVGKVTSVDMDNYSIKVKATGRAELYDVRLKAGIDEIKDGWVEIPKVDTDVLIGIIGNDKNTCFVIKTSEVEITKINDGENGGIPIATKIQENFDALWSYVQDLKTAIANGLNAVGVSTAANGPAASTSFNAEMAPKTVNFENMENDKVLH